MPKNESIDQWRPPTLSESTRKRKVSQGASRSITARTACSSPQRIMAELQASRILRAVYSERQLQEVMVDFWTNHFNIFAGKGADRWLLPAYDRDTIRPHAMAKFSTLLQATAQSPAMLFYLDNFQSVSPNTQQRPRRATATATWHQRKLCARVDGAAHARSRRRLHTERRAGSRSLFYWLDHLSAARWRCGGECDAGRSRASQCRHVLLQRAHTRRRRKNRAWATRFPPVAESKTA